MSARAAALVPALLALLGATACRTGPATTTTVGAPAPGVAFADRAVVVPADKDAGRAKATLGATLARPDALVVRGPGVVLVPGAGDVSRAGTRTGDGARAYAAPVDVTTRLQEELARAGLLSLAYDKRTCGPQDDARCKRNPTADVDARGPAALAADVDAACAQLESEPGFDGRLVLWAHGQGAAVALSSSCAARAAVIVVASPIPRGVDVVIVDGLDARSAGLKAAAAKAPPEQQAQLQEQALDLRNQAASRKRTFESMAKGLFDEKARVQGATLAFWRSWIELTRKTPDLVAAARAPVVVVLSATDAQYAPADRDRIQALAQGPARLVVLDAADHNLLVGGAWDARAVQPVLDALQAALDGRS